MAVLVTGGAGYIGGHVVRSLLSAGFAVTVVDDLSTGRAQVVPAGVSLSVCSISDTAAMRAVLEDTEVTGVVHLAALKSVEESERDPARYYRENVGGMASLLEVCRDHKVEWFLLSSTAAVYGSPDSDAVAESHAPHPESAYGESKLACEWMLRRSGTAYGIRWAALRYFNVVGAAEPTLGDPGTGNLFPRVLAALGSGEPPIIFGDDYPTADGTCVRDYVDVADVADAHAVVADALARDLDHAVFNVGAGRGTSVREVIDGFLRVTGQDASPLVRARRVGDPAAVVADPTLLQEQLGWRAQRSLDESVRAAVQAWRWAAEADGLA